MNKQEILQKVQNVLDNKKINYIKNSLKYLKYEENGMARDGVKKNMHLICYYLDIQSDNLILHTVFVDAETDDLMYIITPHGYIEIEK
ncbi:hypothetical protein [uncultured Flavobacterium sp.]|uniref:hypothetical protein n=1 Tax=uncultured Flavobacterium sp. TaxID=165435 RepID=UPI0011F7306D|nr:hypothetical protein [uncultured Flavobacterium sp.]THD32150.1 MAG: hypothetical protein DI588_08605 [Flavobacterium johnsoniae]